MKRAGMRPENEGVDVDNGESAAGDGAAAAGDGAAAAGDGAAAGRLLIIGGAEDMCCGAGLLERFVELCGGGGARIVLVTTAHGTPDQVHADYERVFRKLGVDRTILNYGRVLEVRRSGP